MSRICKILYGLETVFEGLICDCVVLSDCKLNEDGRVTFKVHVRKWHPTYWLGFIRCRWLGDRCGAVYYGKQETQPEEIKCT